MTTPLKALIQERLRAKIVRQGDDDSVVSNSSTTTGDAYSSTFSTATLASTMPLIDPSEYMVPSTTSSTRSPTRSYTGNYTDSLGFQENDHDDRPAQYLSRRHFVSKQRPMAMSEYGSHSDEYATLPERTNAIAASRRVQSFKSKRPWRPAQDRARRASVSNQMEDESAKYYPTQSAESVGSNYSNSMAPGRSRQNGSDDGSSAYRGYSPRRRKNYDLSHAYQRYRERSVPREESRATEASQDDHGKPLSASWSSEPPRRRYAQSARHYNEEDEYNVANETDYAASEERAPLWRESVMRGNAAAMEDTIGYDPGMNDAIAPSALPKHPPSFGGSSIRSRRFGDVHPVRHIAPSHPIVVSPGRPNAVSGAKRRGFSPRTSHRPFSTSLPIQHSFPGAMATHGDRLVFPAALHIPAVPRSPTVHFHRDQDDWSVGSTSERLGRIRCYDDILSPESRQAAEDFVEKRQKRSSQGTPRTMATHRWLQSMVDARRDQQSAITPATATRPPMASGTTSNNNNNNNYHNNGMDNNGDYPPSNDHRHACYTENDHGNVATAAAASSPFTSPVFSDAQAPELPPAFFSPRRHFFPAEI